MKKSLEKTLRNRPDLIMDLIGREGGERFWLYFDEILNKE
jgi:hypothetical protein